MSEHGATLQTYNQELVKCLEELKIKRDDILKIINKEETERLKLVDGIHHLNQKLLVVDNNLKKHRSLYENCEKTIKDTECGFKKILESSQTLLCLAQQEASKLQTTNKS